MKKFVEEPVTKKQLRKVKKRWVVAATSAALIGAGGVLPEIAGLTAETITVHAAEESDVPEWSANTVNEVEQEVEAQNARDTLSYQIRWGDTLSALSVVTGFSVEEIAVQNNIENPDLIYAGELLSGDTNTSQPTEEIVEQEQDPSEAEELQAAEEQPEAAPAEENEEAPEAVEEEPAEEADEIVPGETVEPMETNEEKPVAKIVVPEDADEEAVEEVIPDKIEEVDVQEVIVTEEIVEPADKIVTEQSVAVVAEPVSHKEPSEAFIQPGQGYLSSAYGYRANPISGERRLHAGMDIAGSGDILVVQSGTVVAAQYQSGWGNYVKIDHGNGIQTLYAHLQDGSIPVTVGDTVSQSQTIGTMGQTGSATGVHLHFEVYVNGVQVDPAPYL